MNRPWMQLHTRDWLDNKELRRCTAESRAVLSDLMCLAHEGFPYGNLADSCGPLTEEYMAARCVLPPAKFRRAVDDLKRHSRLHEGTDGVLFIKRMVEDEDVRSKRAAGGKLGGNPNIQVKVPVNVKVNLPVNLTPNLNANHQGYPVPRVHADTRSGIDSLSISETLKPSGNKEIFSPEEFESAWERHLKHVRDEPKQLVLQSVISMDNFDVGRFRDRHPRYCASWAVSGWQFCPLSFLGWIQAGMPEPPAPSAPRPGDKPVYDARPTREVPRIVKPTREEMGL